MEGIKILVGQGAGRGHNGPPALRGIGNTAEHTKFYDNKAVTAGATGEGNGEIQEKYLKGMKELFFKEVTRAAAKVINDFFATAFSDERSAHSPQNTGSQ